jgi:Na+/H+ antiporter NhaA
LERGADLDHGCWRLQGGRERGRVSLGIFLGMLLGIPLGILLGILLGIQLGLAARFRMYRLPMHLMRRTL